jgi:hypothetical protein
MGHIYRSAKIFDVWLGEEADGSDTVSTFVPILLDTEQKQRVENDERSIMELTATDRRKYGLPYWIDLRYLSLLLVVSRPWFSRVWIIQEPSLGSNIMVYCCRWHMPWNSFTQAVEWVIELGLNIFFSKSMTVITRSLLNGLSKRSHPACNRGFLRFLSAIALQMLPSPKTKSMLSPA